MKLSVIIPCYNEINTIVETIDAVKSNPYKNIEIIIVDDCSDDGTKEKLKNEIEPLGKVDKIVYHDSNKGKGASIKSGFEFSTGELVIIQDADLEYDPNEFPLLLNPILQGKADVVFGSRFRGGNVNRVLYFWHRVGNVLLTILSNMLTNLNLTDMEVCYKVFRREILEKIEIKEKRFGFEPEITAKVAKLNCRIYEVGISYYGRTYDEGKKIGWKDGIKVIYCILKYNIFD